MNKFSAKQTLNESRVYKSAAKTNMAHLPEGQIKCWKNIG